MSTKNRLNFDQTYTNYKIVKTFFLIFEQNGKKTTAQI